MAFKRFGGDFDGGNDSGNLSIAIVGIVILVLCCAFALISNSVGFIFIGFAVCGLFGLFAMAKSGSPNHKSKNERFEKHIQKAEELYKAGDITGAKESFRRAKIYGDPSKEYTWLQEKIGNN